jgi:hypothetical protein
MDHTSSHSSTHQQHDATPASASQGPASLSAQAAGGGKPRSGDAERQRPAGKRLLRRLRRRLRGARK